MGSGAVMKVQLLNYDVVLWRFCGDDLEGRTA